MNARQMVDKLESQGIAGIVCGKETDNQCEWGEDAADRCREAAAVVVVFGAANERGTAVIPVVLCKAHGHAVEDEYERRKANPFG